MKKQRGNVDIISNLPGHIVDKILSCSSLRDAVRTSILSKKWRYKWVTIPSLVFDTKFAIRDQRRALSKDKLVTIIDRFLLLHAGPILKFKLAHRDLEGGSDIDRWILYLSRVGSVKEFILHIFRGDRYKVPWSMYSCKKLTHLELLDCVLKPPPEFNGFKSLKCLDLQNITMEQFGFEKMISSCPLLESLTLKNFDGFTVLNIHAPNLLYLDVVGDEFECISLLNTFNLTAVSVSLLAYYGIQRNIVSGNLVKFFTCLPHIQRLSVVQYFFEYLADGTIPKKLPTSYLDLTFLSIDIDFNCTKEYLAAVCLLRSSPNLKELELQGCAELSPSTEDNTAVNFERFTLTNLRLIKLAGISGSRQELSFIEFLLENAPLLQRMTIKRECDGTVWDLVVKELLCFQRASPPLPGSFFSIPEESSLLLHYLSTSIKLNLLIGECLNSITGASCSHFSLFYC